MYPNPPNSPLVLDIFPYLTSSFFSINHHHNHQKPTKSAKNHQQSIKNHQTYIYIYIYTNNMCIYILYTYYKKNKIHHVFHTFSSNSHPPLTPSRSQRPQFAQGTAGAGRAAARPPGSSASFQTRPRRKRSETTSWCLDQGNLTLHSTSHK